MPVGNPPNEKLLKERAPPGRLVVFTPKPPRGLKFIKPKAFPAMPKSPLAIDRFIRFCCAMSLVAAFDIVVFLRLMKSRLEISSLACSLT